MKNKFKGLLFKVYSNLRMGSQKQNDKNESMELHGVDAVEHEKLSI